MRKKISFEHKLYAGFMVAIILIITISILSSYYSDRRVNTGKSVQHTYEVLNEAGQTLSFTRDIIGNGRNYIITGDTVYFSNFISAKKTVATHVTKLKELTKDNPLQQVRVDSLAAYINERSSFLFQYMQIKKETGIVPSDKLAAISPGVLNANIIKAKIAGIQQEENNLLGLRQKENRESIASFNQAFNLFLASVAILMLVMIIAIRINISIRKKNEQQKIEAAEKIRESEQVFSNLFYKSPIMKAIAEIPSGKYIEVNDAFADFMGYPKEKIIGQTSVDLNMFVHPEERALTMKHLEKDGFARDIETQVNSANDTTRWVSTNIDKIVLNGRLCYMTAAIDITKRKIAEEKLVKFNRELEQKVFERTEEIEKSEKKYRYLFENNPMPMWVIDLATFRFLDVNEMAVLQYGYSREAFLSMTALDIRPDEEKELFKQSNHSFQTHSGNYNKGIWKHRKKDGGIIQVEIIGHEIMFEGIPARFILSNNVTEKKKAEEKLIASEKQFRETLDNMLEGAQIIDFNWRYIYINDSLAKHGKYSKEEMIGYTVMEKYPGIEQTDIFKVYQQCFDERVSIHLENEFAFPDNTKGWFELSFQPVPEGIFILSIDITERKKAEEAILRAEANYREIFDKASDAIYVHEIETGRVLEVNNRASEITGYSKEEIIHGNPQDFITDDPAYSFEHAAAYLQKAAAGQPQIFEWLGKNKDGSNNWLEVNLKKASIAGAERILAFFREINDRKKAQFEIQKLNEDLEQKVIDRTSQLESAIKELEAFSYSVSHDLRAPLRSIVGFSSILEDEYGNKLGPEGKRISSVIKKNTMKMGDLIDDLLAFSRVGKQDIVKTKIDTNKIVQEIISEQDTRNNKNNIIWEMSSLPEMYADISTMRQVWVNFISNAIKYSQHSNQPRIEIGSLTDDTQTVFFVKDNGVGFNNKYNDKLFKVFQRLHSTNEFEGTGVGLAIVEKVISKHGGKVWATAEINKGATFYFSLPKE